MIDSETKILIDNELKASIAQLNKEAAIQGAAEAIKAYKADLQKQAKEQQELINLIDHLRQTGRLPMSAQGLLFEFIAKGAPKEMTLDFICRAAIPAGMT